MKCLLINLIVFVVFVDSDTRKTLFLPNLPIGEYKINFLGIVPCNLPRMNEKIKYNFYLSKTSVNTTEVKGNSTYLIPLDDSLNIELSMAIKDSIGGWKENAHMYKTPRACSSLKMFLGETWTEIMNGLGVYNATCPIPVGFYTASGFSTGGKMSNKYIKKFFYGTYKFRYRYTKNNEVYACVTFVLEVKRPWESD